MKMFRSYRNIKNFLLRFTLLHVGKLHIRLHTILDKDQSTLFHNHPFNYVSIVLKGGYTETLLNGKSYTYRVGSIIYHRHSDFHRIDSIKGKTTTLFIAFGKYTWNAINTASDIPEDGIFIRTINQRKIWSKRQQGIWFIGNDCYVKASKETRHSIHQI